MNRRLRSTILMFALLAASAMAIGCTPGGAGPTSVPGGSSAPAAPAGSVAPAPSSAGRYDY